MSPAATVPRAHSASVYTADTRPPLALIANLINVTSTLHGIVPSASSYLLRVFTKSSTNALGGASLRPPLSANVSKATERRSKASWVDRTEKRERERESGTTTTKGSLARARSPSSPEEAMNLDMIFDNNTIYVKSTYTMSPQFLPVGK